MGLSTVRATRFVTPLREGGSMPGLVEADDLGLYVLKFRGAGQGTRALAAELIGAGLARAAGLPVPDVVLVELDPDLGRAEPDPEVQDLIRASGGLNAGVDFLPGALPYTPGGPGTMTPERAAEIVWLDALIENVDRTPRNPNLLVWHGTVHLIDFGAAFYRFHREDAPDPARPFALIEDHVLRPVAGDVRAAGERLAPQVEAAIAGVVAGVPADWGIDTAPYAAFLAARIGHVP
jgi:hypothetical protein